MSNPELRLDPGRLDATLEPLERATMLPTAAFTDQSVLAWELEHLFAGGWICAGHASCVAEPGAYVMREIGTDESFLVVGGEDGPSAFLNVCRHRGSRLVEEAEGRAERTIRCPYHAWSYGFDGALRAAPHTDGIEDFDPAGHGLVSIPVAVVGGLVLVHLGDGAPDAAEHVGDLAERLDRYRVAELERVDTRVYEVGANWKAIAENYNECLHCPGVHPELNALSDYSSGQAFSGAGAWCGGSMTLNEGAETMGRDGGRSGRSPIGGLEPSELASVFYFALFPNALVSLHPDYVMLHTLWPRATDRTDVICEWLFEPATMRTKGFDPSDAVEFWDQVNREDWHVCALTQRGMQSRGFEPGRYTTQEGDVHKFDVMVADAYLEALTASVGATS
jgi:phenylpropionate dioxygenase-like ring-hydroxylating dioxygenase large terminal subunit